MSVETENEEMLALAELMESRANVYKVLSRCLREEMDAGFAAELSEEFSFASSDEELSHALSDIRNSVTDVDEDAIEQLAVVFDRVFFGMGPITARHAFPYESVYTSEKGILMQEAYTQVVRAYREQHLAKEAGFTEPEDHIAVELAFMATLAERSAAFLREGHEEAAEETVSQQLTFLDTHLMNWVEVFCADLEMASTGTFYAYLAVFLRLYLHADRDLLEEMLD